MTTAILTGHCLDVLAGLPERHYHCLVTSPPFYSLRSYSTEPQVWGGDGSCGEGGHEWGDEIRAPWANSVPGPAAWPGGSNPGMNGYSRNGSKTSGALCRCCHAWRGELGSEPVPDCLAWARGEPPEACRVGCFLCHLRLVMAAVARVLRDDGVAFVELGDGYSGYTGNRGVGRSTLEGRVNCGQQERPSGYGLSAKGIPAKSLILAPERFRLAMVSDGWVVRSVIRWCKRAPMPESIRDRPTSAVSEVVMLAKGSRYFSDLEAVKEGASPLTQSRGNILAPPKAADADAVEVRSNGRTQRAMGGHVSSRNPRNYAVLDPADWTPPPDYVLLSPEPQKRAHYASYGPKAITPLVKMATSERGCCAECGAAWERVTTEPTGGAIGASWHDHEDDPLRGNFKTVASAGYLPRRTTGWRPRCACFGEFVTETVEGPGGPVDVRVYVPRIPLDEHPTQPCRVLDIFGGSGTTNVVCEQLGIDSTYIDASPTYAEMARECIANVAPLWTEVVTIGEAPVGPTQGALFAEGTA